MTNANASLGKIMTIVERNISEKVEKHLSALRVELRLDGNDEFMNALVRKVAKKSIDEHFPVTRTVCDEDH
jgi:hypothetical protein